MWTRGELKSKAKAVLRKIYWKAFGVSLVIAIASSVGGGGGGGGSSQSYSNLENENFLSIIVFILIAMVVLFIVAVLLFRILLGYPLEVGGRKYFIQSAQYSDNKKCFRFAFKKENYKGIVISMLRRGVQTLLWFLLFIIPGIIKYYAYSMVPYILADNPNIGHSKAIKLSNKMTRGHKFDMFLLDLSFIGWCFLGTLCFGIGVLFVLPYIDATKAELYLVLRSNSSDNELLSPEVVLQGY